MKRSRTVYPPSLPAVSSLGEDSASIDSGPTLIDGVSGFDPEPRPPLEPGDDPVVDSWMSGIEPSEDDDLVPSIEPYPEGIPTLDPYLGFNPIEFLGRSRLEPCVDPAERADRVEIKFCEHKMTDREIYEELKKAYVTSIVKKKWFVDTGNNPVPQPDETMGFDRTSFNWEQQARLRHARVACRVNDNILFPFITFEEASQGKPIEEADERNTWSMMVALDILVDLFEKAGVIHQCFDIPLGLSVSYNATHLFFDAYQIKAAEGGGIEKHRLQLGQVREENRCEFIRYLYLVTAQDLLMRIKWATDHLPREPLIDPEVRARWDRLG